MKKSGIPRRVQIKANATLGVLSECTKVLPQYVDRDVVDRLTNKILTLHPDQRHGHTVRHHHICPPPYHMKITESLKCKQKRKPKKKKRKCHDTDGDNDECHVPVKSSDDTPKKSTSNKKTSLDTDTVETHQPKKGKKRKSDIKKSKHQSKSAARKDTSGERNNAEGDADDTMTTIIPDDGADDEFLDKE